MLLIDVGNTSIKWACPKAHSALGSTDHCWENYGVVRHFDIASLKGTWQSLHNENRIKSVLISNVAGQKVGHTLYEYLHELRPTSPKINWFTPELELCGIQNTYQDYKKLGSDRFASMIGAHTLFPNQPLVVVTAGTATTIDSISPDGKFLGGLIIPGLRLMAESLSNNTAQLPKIDHIQQEVSFYAGHTQAAIISGCINAQAGTIERVFREHQQHFSQAKCVLSGGAARYVSPHLSIEHQIVDNLVLIGLCSASEQMLVN